MEAVQQEVKNAPMRYSKKSIEEEEREIEQEEPPVIAPQGVVGPEKGGVFPNKKN